MHELAYLESITRYTDHVHMVRHNAPGMQFVSLAIEEMQCLCDDIRDPGILQVTYSVAFIEVPFKSSGVSINNFPCFSALMRIIAGVVSVQSAKSDIALGFQTSHIRFGNGIGKAESNEVHRARDFNMRKIASGAYGRWRRF